jgi:steroid delta-isomerase-like uncharacterized protein
MTREETTDFFSRRETAWRGRNAAALAADHAEHGLLVSPMLATVRGRAAIESSYQTLFRAFPDLNLATTELLIDGDRAAQVFSATATHADDFFGFSASGRRFEIHGVMVFQLEHGLIAHERRVYDFTGLLVQIGVLKAKPA